MDFSNLTDLAFLTQLLSDSGKAALAEKLLVVGVVWLLMGRKVASHFHSLERGMKEGFEKLTASIKEVRDSLTDVEVSHAESLKSLDSRVRKLEDRGKRTEDPESLPR